MFTNQRDLMLITPNHLAPSVSSASRLSQPFFELIPIADWNEPYSFFNPVYQVKNEDGNLQRTIEGTAGMFLGMWYVAEMSHKQIFS